MSRLLTDEDLSVLIEKTQAHSEVMSELGSEHEAEESAQILSALCELKRYRGAASHLDIGEA
ncbi:hypothetical protein AYK88_26715 [Klebsiella aerogenes]|uniref:hypothetical protein n=1 Tax=Klebsiella aerogenes TaxID=548 RepID=UPI0007E9AD97|nr:hypothetical protein [Klebsiella aerogenes]OAZ18300.1 hypothetical protein AW170_26735 [Klebsiella aerogenes]OAZ32943.1 hypothetical protein AYK88_26715 [Klebsiella aerogenes]OOL21631.1 hypothetical protein BXQ27_27165 [Klebsiella aerogenes]